jgi:Uma2 family endonuclease
MIMAATHATEDEIKYSDAKPHPGRRMTEAQFVAWCDDKTWAEWVDGEVILMSPVNAEHSDLFRFLFTVVSNYADHYQLGELHSEPMQVRFGELRRRRSPDFFFVADARKHIIKKAHIEGAPDLIVEIVSPDSQSRDRREKYEEYERVGVREYWIVDPLSQRVEIYALRAGKYHLLRERDGAIASRVLKGFKLKPEWLWREKRPRIRDVMKELGAL